MQQTKHPLDKNALRGVRVCVIANTGEDLGEVESALRIGGAIVQRLPPDPACWRSADGNDVVLFVLDESTIDDGEQPSEAMQSLVDTCAVIALVHGSYIPEFQGLRDVVFAPFRPAEIVARVTHVVGDMPVPAELRAGNLTLHRLNRTISVDGQPIVLTYREFEILLALMLAEGAVLSREHLAARFSLDASPRRTVDIHIHRLRAKLRGLRAARIETVREVGYRLAVESEHQGS